MARTRLLKPGFFENEDLARLPDKARLLYQGLWLYADRSGRLEDRPLRIRGQVFPYEMVDCDDLLRCLAAKGFIRRYTVGEIKVIDIPKFLVHQSPHIREPHSKLPAFSQGLGSHGASTVPAQDEHQASPPVLDPVSDPVSDPGAAQEHARAARSRRVPVVGPLFAKFWSAYPRKVNKGDAEKAWAALAPDTSLLAAMLSALEWQCRQPAWLKDGGQFVPYPGKWLRGRAWDDEPFNAPDPTDAAWAEVEEKIGTRRTS